MFELSINNPGRRTKDHSKNLLLDLLKIIKPNHLRLVSLLPPSPKMLYDAHCAHTVLAVVDRLPKLLLNELKLRFGSLDFTSSIWSPPTFVE